MTREQFEPLRLRFFARSRWSKAILPKLLLVAILGPLSASRLLAQACGVNPATLPNPTAGVPYSQTLTGSGGTGPYSFSVTSGTLPTGLTLASGGLISGTPTATGPFTFDVGVTGLGCSPGSRRYSVTVGCPIITILPAALPRGTIGVAYSQTLSGSGGTAPYMFSIISGSLPPGLTLSAGGLISGTPTATGTFGFTAGVTDAFGCPGSRNLSILVCPVITISPPALPNGMVGVSYVQNLMASGGASPHAFTVTSGSLPPGVTLSMTGTLSGTPSSAGTFAFTVTATDAAGCTGTKNYTLTVCGMITVSPPALPNGTVGVPYNQTLTGSGGTSPYSFAVTSGSLPAGLTLSSGGVISGTPLAASIPTPFTVTATDANSCTGSRTYTITICPAIAVSPVSLPNGTVGAAYSQTITASGGAAPYTFTVTSGSLPSGLTLTPSTGVISGTPVATGSSTFTVTATDSASCTGSRPYTVSIVCPAIVVAPATLPGGTVGTAYSQTITASGGAAPYTFAVTSGSLPLGLTLSSGGLLSGTPSAGGISSFTITATAVNGCTGSRDYTLTVSAAGCPSILVSPATLPAGTLGSAYSQTLTASGGTAPYTFTVTGGSLPPGLTLSSAGVLAGTPSATGTSNFTVTATDAGSCPGSRTFSFSVADSCPAPGAVSTIRVRGVGVADPNQAPSPTDLLSVTFTPPVGGTPPVRYGIRINGGTEFSATGPNVILPARGNPNPFTVFVTAYACTPQKAGPEASSGPITLFLTPPGANFTISPNPRVGMPVQFTDTSTPQAVSWLWIFDDGTTDARQSPPHTFTTGGTHFAALIATNGAGSTARVQTFVLAPSSALVRVEPSHTVGFDAADRLRHRAHTEISGEGRTWLVIENQESDETVVFLRFFDILGDLREERRLSIPAGGESVNDLGAYGLRGTFLLELVTSQKILPSLREVGRAMPKERRR